MHHLCCFRHKTVYKKEILRRILSVVQLLAELLTLLCNQYPVYILHVNSYFVTKLILLLGFPFTFISNLKQCYLLDYVLSWKKNDTSSTSDALPRLTTVFNVVFSVIGLSNDTDLST